MDIIIMCNKQTLEYVDSIVWTKVKIGLNKCWSKLKSDLTQVCQPHVYLRQFRISCVLFNTNKMYPMRTRVHVWNSPRLYYIYIFIYILYCIVANCRGFLFGGIRAKSIRLCQEIPPLFGWRPYVFLQAVVPSFVLIYILYNISLVQWWPSYFNPKVTLVQMG